MAEEHVFDLLPGYALGILDEEDLLKASRHLAHCTVCQEELSTYNLTLVQLSLETPLKTPSPDLREKVIQRVASRVQSAHVVEKAGAPAFGSTRTPAAVKKPSVFEQINALLSPRLAWALGGFAILALIILGVMSAVLSQRINALQAQVPGGKAQLIHLAGTQDAPQATGYLLVFQGDDYGTLTIESAPMLDANHQYQIWLMKDGARTSGGVFSVSGDGYGVLEISANQPLTDYQSFGITIEPKGGSPAPTGKRILLGGF